MTPIEVLAATFHDACTDPRCTSLGRQTWHVDPAACPYAGQPIGCAACGARWVEDRGDRVLLHRAGCAYVEAMAS